MDNKIKKPVVVADAVRENIHFWTEEVERLENLLAECYEKRRRVRFNQAKFAFRDAVKNLAENKAIADNLGIA